MQNKFLTHIMILFACGFLLISGCKKPKLDESQSKYFIKYYGGGVDQFAGNVELTPDGGYILAGTTSSFGNGGEDAYLIKTDKFGNQEWMKTFGGTGNDQGRSVKVTPDGGYILLGSFRDIAFNKTDMYLIKTDGSGNQQWARTFGDTAFNESGYAIDNTLDGGFILVGTTSNVDSLKNGGSNKITDGTDVFLLKTDASGNMEWVDTYGFNSFDEGLAVQQIDDSIYLTSGFSIGQPGIIQPDGVNMLIVQGRVQVSGTVYTPNVFINKNNPINEVSIANAVDVKYLGGNSYVVLGTTTNNTAGNGTDIYLLKADLATGNKAWFRTYGGTGDEYAKSVFATADGGFIICGTTSSEGNGAKDVFVIKVDQDGNESWRQTFGGDGDDEGGFIRQTPDGGYVLSATISFGGSGTGANKVLSLIKVNKDGKLEE